MSKPKTILGKIVLYLILIAAIIAFVLVYKKYNYNDFIKSMEEPGKTEFTRDSEVKYSKMDSYKLENLDYQDSLFYQTIEVTPNLPYKVSCKVKVENVENKDNTLLGGAQVSILGTTERSETIKGTSDWQTLNFYFNSKNRTSVDIAFRLGGYAEKSKGTAWFSDFKVEVGTANTSRTWKMICFIFPNIDVNVEVNGKQEHVKLQMSQKDISSVYSNLERMKTTIPQISKNQMQIEYETMAIKDPITTLSYDSENGYYVSITDVYPYIHSYLKEHEYDHIFIAFRMADIQKGSSALVNDWIGLGGMDYLGIGFSNIRMADNENNYAYEYDYRINTFPEEVFIHEFLHTLERNSKEYGYEVPDLHEYEKYGYKDERPDGQRQWYEDYMNSQIDVSGKKIGLPKEIYTYKPVNSSNFKHSIDTEYLQEPKNIIEVIKSFVGRIGKMFSYMKENGNAQSLNHIENQST